MKATMAVTVSLEEIFVNIANYAYPDHKGKATIGMSFKDDWIEVYLFDNGIPFNPLEKEDPNVKAELEERDIGGLGIYMAKKSMDECRYERKGNQNRFYMKRRIRG
jgi:anti-sigma regulatory factor (Ser/Thr protein kinase)